MSLRWYITAGVDICTVKGTCFLWKAPPHLWVNVMMHVGSDQHSFLIHREQPKLVLKHWCPVEFPEDNSEFTHSFFTPYNFALLDKLYLGYFAPLFIFIFKHLIFGWHFPSKHNRELAISTQGRENRFLSLFVLLIFSWPHPCVIHISLRTSNSS